MRLLLSATQGAERQAWGTINKKRGRRHPSQDFKTQ